MKQIDQIKLDSIDERELNGCKRSFEAGNFGAVLAAIRWCRRHDLTAPPWLLDASHALIVEAIRHIKSGKPGRAGNPLARLRQDMIHFARWDTVQMLREKQKETAAEVAGLRKLKSDPSVVLKERDVIVIEEEEKKLQWLGRSWEMAYRCASAALRGTDSFAGPDAMKASYLKVQKLSEDPKQALRFRLVDPYTMQQLNLSKVFEPPQDKKPRVLFDPDR